MTAPTMTTAAPSPQAKGKEVPQLAMVPFARATYLHEEPFLDTTLNTSTSSQAVNGGFVDVPSYGYARFIVIEVNVAGGTGAAAVYKEDAPWSILSEIQLADVNGAPIFGPIGGYSAFINAATGGYFGPNGNSNPGQWQQSTTPTTAGNFRCYFLVPLELSNRDHVGALPNMNSAQAYKLRLTLAPRSAVYSTDPTGLPTVRVRASLMALAQPNPTGSGGAPLAQQPPAVGTTQFVTETTFPIGGAGQQTLLLPRRGNMIRNLMCIWRDNTGARSNAYPDPIALYRDSVLIKNQHFTTTKNELSRTYGQLSLLANIAGLWCYPFHDDFHGGAGQELRNHWLPTLQSTRLELVGTFGTAGQLTVITNDVAPNGDVYIM